MERQEKVDKFYEKLRYEEMNPRPINKEKEMRIEELKEKNLYLNEKIKCANRIIEQDLEKRGEKIIDDIKKKELKTKRILEEKVLMAKEIKEENDEKYKAVESNYQLIENDRKNRLEEMREELDDKKMRVNEFLKQKKLLAQEARFISDQITYQKQLYKEQFDKMFSKKGLDENNYNNVKGMIAGDPRFKEICQYYEGNNKEP